MATVTLSLLGVAGVLSTAGAWGATPGQSAPGASGAPASPPVGDAQEARSAMAASTNAPVPLPPAPYYLASPDGAVWPLAGARDLGSMAGQHLNGTVVGVTMTPDRAGYWLVGSDGGIFSFGDAAFHGSTGSMRLNQPIIGMTATPDGRGYWLYASDGGIFTFGDAHFYGSTGNHHLSSPIVAIAAATGDQGYWEMSADGAVFPFGDTHVSGSLASVPLGQGVAQIIAGPTTGSYWEVAHDGDVYGFGTPAGALPPTVALLHTIESQGDVALEWAMAQLGKPYLWGGSGPAAFDCSGLVMRAWEAAGVDIPRVAADQYNFGTHVPIAQLHMGDLVFWASNTADPSTIYHVALYLGNGQMVNAPYTGQVVRTDWIGGSDFVGLGTQP